MQMQILFAQLQSSLIKFKWSTICFIFINNIMKRDGALESIWQHQLEDLLPKETNETTETYDVLIAGGGITGLSTALLLQKAGKKCVIAEMHNIGFGTTAGTTAHLNNFFDTSYNTVEKDFGEENARLLATAAEEAMALIKKNIKDYNIECDYEEKEACIFATDEEQQKLLEDLVEGGKKYGLKIDFKNDSPYPIPFIKLASIKGQAQFHPVKYIFGLAKAFEDAGGVIMDNCKVTDVEEGSTITIETTRGDIKANQLIWATHIPTGVNLLHFRAAPYRSYVLGLILNDNNYPQDLGYDMAEPYRYYRTHTINGQSYLIAGGEDHKTAHEENTDVPFQRLESYVRQFYDVKEVAFKWSSQYFEPADGLAYIGNLPGNGENVWVATGFGGNGMTYGHVAAITLSETLINGDSKYRELFDPNRIKPVAGFTNFVKESVDVVKELVSGKFSGEKIKELNDLAAGEAKVVQYEGEKIAMYKDEQHNIHAVNPTCTHIHCTVSWNTAEKSWDCPCHGARYNCDGEVITGPATKNLAVVDLS